MRSPSGFPIKLQIPFKTLLTIAAFILLCLVIAKLALLLTLMVISVILAVAAQPMLRALERHGPRWMGVTAISAFVLGVMVILCFGVFPPLANQISVVAAKAPAYLQKTLQHFSQGPALYSFIEHHLKAGVAQHASTWFESMLNFGQMAVEGLSSLVLVYVFFIYFMVDGPRTYRWLLAFFKEDTQKKLKVTGQEVSGIMSAYVLGQIITSVLATIFVFIALQALKVPAALMLAVLAGVFDVLPVLGFFLSLVPALIFAMTVSPTTAFVVLVIYVVYHAIENYLILPYVYGNRLRMSGLVVLVSLLAAGLVGGLVGALIIMPIVASYPIIEKIWLAPYLGEHVIRDHADEKVKPPRI